MTLSEMKKFAKSTFDKKMEGKSVDIPEQVRNTGSEHDPTKIVYVEKIRKKEENQE